MDAGLNGPRYEQHLRRIKKELADILDVSFTASPFRALNNRFLVACSARSGSHLLCHGLMEHGAVVREHFDPKQIKRLSFRWEKHTLEAYCRTLVRRFAPRGVFGVKGGIQILAPLMLAGEIPDHLADWRFVYLSRADGLKQAISHFIATQTGAFKATAEPTRTLTDQDFDGKKIAGMVRRNRAINVEWEEFFADHGIEPIRVVYEEMVADMPGTVGRVARGLDLRGPPAPGESTPPVKRQATSLNADWGARFLAEGWPREG
ncbi:MAG: hypothetical protein H0X27_08615 [Caulobacteraceae bacterium]|nr:hypothetical protein [Caulobacteraceae bacterium]